MKFLYFLACLWLALDLIALAITYLLRRRNKYSKSEGFESLKNYIIGGNKDIEDNR